MRFAAWIDPADAHRGVREGVWDRDGLLHPLPPGDTLAGLLAGGAGVLLAAGRHALDAPGVPVDRVRLRPPVRPPSIRDFATFEEHVEGMGRATDAGYRVPEQWYAAPAFYFANPQAVLGPYDDVPVPPGSRRFDYELEVGAVIGRGGANIAPAGADRHIAGYVVLNDWSARDLLPVTAPGTAAGPAKGKDTAITLGPCLVTADELEPYRRDGRLDLRMQVWLNDMLLGTDTLANMAWSWGDLVAYASRGTRLVPGDVLGSGTCGGGCLMELWGRSGRQDPPPLSPGDVVTMTVEGIGSIRNRVVAGVEPVPVPPARRGWRGWREVAGERERAGHPSVLRRRALIGQQS